MARRAAVSLSSALVALMRRDDARWGETGVELCASSFRDDDLRCVGDVLEDLSASEASEDDVTRRAMRLLCENIARSGGGGALAWTLALVPRVWDAFGTRVDDARVGEEVVAAIGDGFERRRVDVCVDVARRGRRARERASTGEDAHRLSDAATRVRRRASGDAVSCRRLIRRGALPRVRVRRWRRGTGRRRRRRRRRRRCETRCDEPARRARGGSQSARRGSGCERTRRAHRFRRFENSSEMERARRDS